MLIDGKKSADAYSASRRSLLIRNTNCVALKKRRDTSSSSHITAESRYGVPKKNLLLRNFSVAEYIY